MVEEKEELQRKILEFQILEAELRVIEQRGEELLRRLEDLNRTRIALEDLKPSKSEDALVPLGSGSFIHGKVTDSENVVIAIGAGIAAKKTKEQALEILDERISEVEQTSEKFAAQTQIIFNNLRNLQVDIEKMQK